jgi:hypothetical protein
MNKLISRFIRSSFCKGHIENNAAKAKANMVKSTKCAYARSDCKAKINHLFSPINMYPAILSRRPNNVKLYFSRVTVYTLNALHTILRGARPWL